MESIETKDKPGETPMTGETPMCGETLGETPGETPGETSESKPVVEHINEDMFYGFIDNFDKTHDKDNKNNYILKNPKYKEFYREKDDIFYCKSDNGINEKKCFVYNELCKNCQMLNQAYHKLKRNYLLNSAGRVCTYKKGKMFCLGEFQRVFSVYCFILFLFSFKLIPGPLLSFFSIFFLISNSIICLKASSTPSPVLAETLNISNPVFFWNSYISFLSIPFFKSFLFPRQIITTSFPV